jgi:hypothetical protein
MTFAVPTLAVLLAVAAPDSASAPSESATVDGEIIATNPSSSARGPRPDLVAPVLDREYSIRVNRRARGVGIGFRQGVWGDGFGQALHLDIPFGRRVGQFFGARVSGTVVHGQVDDRYDPVAFGGLELFGRSPVMGGVVRVYGGGGAMLGGRLRPEIEGRRYGVAGGGHLGLEAFVTPWISFSVEVGGQGPVHAMALDGGANVMGGVNLWFGRR